jgi:hypothetical protein
MSCVTRAEDAFAFSKFVLILIAKVRRKLFVKLTFNAQQIRNILK